MVCKDKKFGGSKLEARPYQEWWLRQANKHDSLQKKIIQGKFRGDGWGWSALEMTDSWGEFMERCQEETRKI